MLQTWGGVRVRTRHRIEPPWIPGMAATDPLERQPAATQRTVLLQRVSSVARTRRIEPAVRTQERTQCELIYADQRAEELAHCAFIRFQKLARLARSAAGAASRVAPRAAMTMSTGGKACCAKRKDSRIMRRSRLRATAEPAVFMATAIPRRGRLNAFGRTRRPKYLSSKRRLSRA